MELNNAMPPYNAHEICQIKDYEKKTTNSEISKNKNFTAETQYINLKAPSNNVKMQSDKTLTTQIYFFLTIQQMDVFHNEIR